MNYNKLHSSKRKGNLMVLSKTCTNTVTLKFGVLFVFKNFVNILCYNKLLHK